MKTNLFQVDLSGLLRVLSGNLYSSWEVFIRELLQNSNDALLAASHKLHITRGEIYVDYFEEKGQRVLVVTDQGIGLTFEEMEEFLSKIGSSSKRAKKESFEEEQITFIGQFGIGLLSAFMVTDVIEMVSTSAVSGTTLKWIGHANGTYQILEHPKREMHGTSVKLTIKEDVGLSLEKMQELLERYATFLPSNVMFSYNGNEIGRYGKLFPWEEKSIDPNMVITLGQETFDEKFQYYFPIQNRGGSTKGIAYILTHPVHISVKNSHTLYVKHMYITDECYEILPEWAFFVKVILNSEDLSTTASREGVYQNEQLEATKEELGMCIKQYLKSLEKANPQLLKEITSIHSLALKALAIEDDDFFKFISPWFSFPTTEGQLTLKEIHEKSSKVFYVSDVDEFRQIAPIVRANKQLVINAGYIYDTPLLDKLKYFDKSGRYVKIDPEYFGNSLNDLDVDVYDSLSSKIQQIQAVLMEFNVEVDVKQFHPNELPAIFYMSQDNIEKRDLENISKDADNTWAGITDSIFDFQTGFTSKIFLNFDNEIVQRLLKMDTGSRKVEPYILMLYFNSLIMGHYPVSTKELQRMNENTLEILKSLI